MRIAVMGAGGIGSYLGGMLSRAGGDVTLVCRGAHLAAVRREGLAVSTPKESFRARPAAADAVPAGMDVILQAVKLYDLEATMRQMLPVLGERTLVVTLQNGVSAA